MDMVNSVAGLKIILLIFTIGLEFNIRKLRQTGLFAIVVVAILVTVRLRDINKVTYDKMTICWARISCSEGRSWP